MSEQFLSFVLDQLDRLDVVTSRRMFGGVGLYCGDLFFGLLDDNRLFFKVDDGNRARHEQAGMRPFQPDPAKPQTMQYYGVPVDVLEDRQALTHWAQEAVDAAARARDRKARRSGTRKSPDRRPA